MTFPGIPTSPAVGDEITAAQADLIASIMAFLSTAPNGNRANVLGPAATIDITTSTVALSLGPISCNPGRSYEIAASANFIKITSAGTIVCSLSEVTSGFSPPLIPSATAASGDLPSGSYTGLWTPNAGQTTATWRLSASSSTAALRLTALCASITMVDAGQ